MLFAEYRWLKKAILVVAQNHKRTIGSDFGSFSCGKTIACDFLIYYREAINVSQKATARIKTTKQLETAGWCFFHRQIFR
jgi:hypothetical protein